MTTRALEDSEIKAIFDCVSGCNATRNRTMLIVGIGMALRASELVGLNVGDVIDTNGNVKTYVTIRGETAKFGKERTIRIGADVKNAIAEFIEYKIENDEPVDIDSPLFVSNKGGHLTRIGLYNLVEKIFSKAGIDQSCHALRKTGATIYYIASDYDLIATQEFLGHANPSTTRRYIGLTTEQLKNYSERMSKYLFSAIENGEKVEKSNTIDKMLDFENASDLELLKELKKRGYDIDDFVEGEQKTADVIKFPKVA